MKAKYFENQLALFGFGDDEQAVVEPPAFVSPKTQLAQALEKVSEPERILFELKDAYLDPLKGTKSKAIANIQAIELAMRGGEYTEEEKIAMARFSGWGGLSAVFDENNADFAPIRTQLKSLISDKWYESAMASVLTAYYTEPHIIRAMWKMIETAGFMGGKVLEPACGNAHFVGAMPTNLRKASSIVGVDCDPLSVKIANGLYADRMTRFINSGIERAPLKSGSFDVVIGNVPFGNFSVHDPKFAALKFMIHDYFFAKSIDMVKAGGLIALITSAGTMDKYGNKLREYVTKKADLIASIRLPNTAFEVLGGTSVMTDIILLRKKPEVSDGMVGEEFIKTTTCGDLAEFTAQHHQINCYYKNHPDDLLGKLISTKGAFGHGLGCKASDDWKSRLEQIASQPKYQGWYRLENKCDEETPVADIDTGIKSIHASGYFFDEDGTLMFLSGQKVEAHADMAVSTRLRIEGMTRIRDCAVELLESDSFGKDSSALRAKLNRLYDDFTSEYGSLMRPVNRRLFSLDSHAPLLWSLERYDEENDKAIKADIFFKATIARPALIETAQSIGDAIALSYNKFARLDLTFMAKALDRAESEVVADLLTEGRIFFDPQSMEYVDSEIYLSGKVREKLATARTAAMGSAEYEVNVKALESVVPPIVPLSEVSIRLGVPWIGADDVSNFLMEIVTKDDSLSITHMPQFASWAVNLRGSYQKKTALFTTEWGIPEMSLERILDNVLNQVAPTVRVEVEVKDAEGKVTKKQVIDKGLTVAAREKAEKLNTAFVDWVYSSQERVDRLEIVYNEIYNGTVNRVYNGSHLVVPGLSEGINLRDAQKDSIWRGLVSGNTLYALAVGGGKTLIQIVLANEAKRLGIASKPCLVVPNHMLEAFAGEYMRAFPRARILAATKNDMEGDKRRHLMMRIATEDWDAVIITHSSFGKIGIAQKVIDDYAAEKGEEAEEVVLGSDDGNVIREAKRQKAMVQAKIQSLGSRTRDNGVLTFDQLGIDFLTVDEADLYKNLWFATRKKNVSGISSTFSARAFDLFLKSRIIFNRRGNDGFGLNFATATPISNTIGECFIMQTYLQHERLRELGLDGFDAWSANFAREVTSIEVSPDGGTFRMHTRFAQFVNVPELMLLFKEVAEIRTKKMLALPEPSLHGGKHTIVTAEPSALQLKVVASLVERARRIRDGEVKPVDDNMLCVTNDGRKAALDIRCLDGSLDDFLDSKLNKCVENVVRHYHEGHSKKLTQLVFCDLSTPKKFGFSVYQHIKDKLIEAGIPDAEIAFAQDYKTDLRKAELHRKVRTGKIRVLIGSTELMGFGTNVQDILIATHHVDAPWRPRDVEQRDGRIIRQGNQNEEVYIYRYVTTRTFDAYSWQGLERKANFIAQVMEGTCTARTVEDITSQALSYAEVKALASGNPLVIEKAGIDSEVSKLQMLKSSWVDGQRMVASKLRDIDGHIHKNQSFVAKAMSDLEHCGDTSVVTIHGRAHHADEKLGKLLMQTLAKVKAETCIGERYVRDAQANLNIKIGEMTLAALVSGDAKNSSIDTSVVGASGAWYHFRLPYGAVNVAEFLTSQEIEKSIRDRIVFAQNRIQELTREHASFEAQSGKSFEYADRLSQALERQAEIDSQLDLNSDDASALAAAED